MIPKTIQDPAGFVEKLSNCILSIDMDIEESDEQVREELIRKNSENLSKEEFLAYVEQSTMNVLQNIQRVVTEVNTAPNPFLQNTKAIKKKSKPKPDFSDNYEDDLMQDEEMEEDDLFDPKADASSHPDDWNFKKKSKEKGQKKPEKANQKVVPVKQMLPGSSRDRIASKFAKKGKKI